MIIKKLIIFVTLFIQLTCFSQILPDSLQKYSYPLIGVHPSIAAGTCFFIQDNGQLYLVTAKHVVLGCESIATKEKGENYPDQFLIGNYKDISKSFSIDMSTQKDQLSCEGLDLYITKINKSFIPFYNSVDKFILSTLESYQSIEMFGYPQSSYKPGILSIPENSAHISIPENTFDFTFLIDSTWNIDTTKFRRVTYSKDIEISQGFSGSPIFLKDRYSANWRVIGLLSATGPVEGGSRTSFLFVDIKHVIDAIKKLN